MQFLINALVVFRLTRLIRDESAPFGIMDILRDELGVKYGTANGVLYGRNEIAKAVACPYCLSFWIALFVSGGNIKQALALSGATSLLYRWFERQ